MNKILKVLGKKGCVIIPFEIRKSLGYNYNDVISFTPLKDGSILLRKEEICDNCDDIREEIESISLEEFLNSLSEEEQRDALVHLTTLWAERRKGIKI